MNIFNLFGIPTEFGILLLTLSLILFLAPYFSGTDFGVIKIPIFSSKAKKRLILFGPFLILGTIILFLPFWSNFYTPLIIQNFRVSHSDTHHRLEITLQNTKHGGDRLINHVYIKSISDKEDSNCDPANVSSYIPGPDFEFSDTLVIQQDVGNSEILFQTEYTENINEDYAFTTTGAFGEDTCNYILILEFDTSMLVPKNKTFQFNVLLPKDSIISELNISNELDSDISTDINVYDVFDSYYRYGGARIEISYAGSNKPAIYVDIP